MKASRTSWGGRRPGAGRPPKGSKPAVASKPSQEAESSEQPLPPLDSSTQPLDYMLSVMRDQNQSADLRAKMAIAAAPYVHPKMGETGKKDQKNEAAKKLASRFGASAAPPRPGNTSH